MPKIVDHDERRQELILFAADYIADHGLENTSFRKLAAAGGFSQNLVSHYFANKEELLWRVQEYVSRRSIERYQAVEDKSLVNIVFQQLPFDREREVEAKVFMNFWTLITHNAQLRDSYCRFSAVSRNQLKKTIIGQIEAGLVSDTARVDTLVDMIVSLTTSLCTVILLDPTHFTRPRCKRLIAESLGDYVLH